MGKYGSFTSKSLPFMVMILGQLLEATVREKAHGMMIIAALMTVITDAIRASKCLSMGNFRPNHNDSLPSCLGLQTDGRTLRLIEIWGGQ